MVSILLKKGKEKAVLQHHPWVFSGALKYNDIKAENGELVKVETHDNVFLAYGYYNNESRVAIRLLSWDESILPDEAWYRKKLQVAIKSRANLLTDGNDTCRLVFSESDYLPGLIVDKYGDYLSVQVSTSGIEKMKPVILDELQKLTGAKGIFDKSDSTARAHDGLAETNGLLAGTLPPDFVEVQENRIKYHINIIEGQKSGFYCDQRFNRKMLASYVSGKTVLDCFSYSGGFTLNALANGAEKVTAVDSSALAIET
ncbi:MAG TPA: class I SAM-dependent rRNA methyltransferase, partial [Pelobium sp.]|nr:class I SAM-dependent rRNA methyltransferase [Pelobium sp.]